ncbi:MAG: class I SAM-dependent methyltransferase [Chloroflexi bacterium]|nr:MAG: class I SAM-dependent methyltransferase [Chloroflexota bacterium]
MIEVNCNLCGRDDWQVRFPATLSEDGLDVSAFRCTNLGYGHHAQIVQCRHCGLVYANPRWSPEELLAAYEAVTDETYVAERPGRELTFRKHLQALERFTGAGNGRSLLDVGAYIGVFVEVATAAGWNACGVEPSAWAAAEAQRRGLNVVQGTLDSPVLDGRFFDVVTMWDVIEHVADPAAELQKAWQRLKPGGWLVVHTMDIDSPVARLMGSRWPWLMDMHLYYFSQTTMRRMLEKIGYRVVWSGAQGRYLRLGYLASRVYGLNRPLGSVARWLVNQFGLAEKPIPVNFGDLFTVYAVKPTGAHN